MDIRVNDLVLIPAMLKLGLVVHALGGDGYVRCRVLDEDREVPVDPAAIKLVWRPIERVG